MRSLRSGKSLPDSPPVMRQPGTPNSVKAKPISQLAKDCKNDTDVAEAQPTATEPVSKPVTTTKKKLETSVNNGDEILTPVAVASVPESTDVTTPTPTMKRSRGRPRLSVIKMDEVIEAPIKIPPQMEDDLSDTKKEDIATPEQDEAVIAKGEVTVNDSQNEDIEPVVESPQDQTPTKSSRRKPTPEVVETPSESLAKSAVCFCGLGFRRQATLQMHQKKCKDAIKHRQKEEENRATAEALVKKEKQKAKEAAKEKKELEKEKSAVKNEEEELQDLEEEEGEQEVSEDLEGSLEDQEMEEEGDEQQQRRSQRGVIPFTKKRPSLSSLALKDPVTCEQCGMTFTRRAHLNRHLLLHSGVKPYQCDVCLLTFTRKDHMFAHRQKHDKPEQIIQCEQCDEILPSYKILEAHMQREHQIPNVSPPRTTPIPQMFPLMSTSSRNQPTLENLQMDTDIICELCGKKFLQKRYLRAHKKVHVARGDYAALEMAAYEENPNFDYTQFATRSGPSSSRSVSAGSTSTSRKSSVFNNKLVQLSTDLAKRKDAKKEQDSSAEMMEVEGAEDEEIDYEYNYEAMGKSFPDELEGYQEEEEGVEEDSVEDDQPQQPREMECSVCGKVFTDRTELRKHYRLHKKRFICRFCGLRLASAGSLMRHNLTHTNVKRYGCRLCDRKFSRKDTLAVHMQAHTKQTTRVNMSRPYLCKICGGSYTMKYNLIRHIKMCHTFSKSAKHIDTMNRIRQQANRDNAAASSSAAAVVEKTPATPAEGQDEGNTEENEKDMVISLNPFDMDFLQEGDEVVNEEEGYEGVEGHAGAEFEEGEEEDGEGEGGFPCHHCSKTFKNAKSLNTHKWYHSRKKCDEYVCHICHWGFKYSTDLARHILTHKEEESNKEDPSAEKTDNNTSNLDPIPYDCVISNTRQLRPLPTLKSQPIAQQQQQNFMARQPQLPQMQSGNDINPVDTRPFGCKLCPQRFNHRSNLSRHMRLIHNNPNATGSSFTLRKPSSGPSMNLQNYLSRLQQQKQRSQRQEGWSQWNLPGKIDTSHTAADTIARNLDPEFRRASAANMEPDSYLYDASSDRPYACKTCLKAFENKNNLWTHMRIHNKAFACTFCGLKVATRGDLILHLRTHTGEKPYSCTMCEWKFSRKSGLNKHVVKYHAPGGKAIRPWKYPDADGNGEPEPSTSGSSATSSSPNPSLKFKITRSPEQDDFHIEKVDKSSLRGMQISMTSMPNKPLPKLTPATITNGGFLKSALQQRQQSSRGSGSPIHRQIGGVTISKIVNTSGSNTSAIKKEPYGGGSSVSITRVQPKLQSQNQNPSVVFLCRKCGTYVTGKQNYIEHMRKHQQQTSIPRPSSLNPISRPSLKLNPQMQVRMPQQQQLQRKAPPKPFRCEECGERFVEQLHLIRHSMAHSQPVRCKLCGKMCSSMAFLSRHYQYAHPEAPNPAELARHKPAGSPEVEQKPVINTSTLNQEKVNVKNTELNGAEDDNGDEEEFLNEAEGPPNRVDGDGKSVLERPELEETAMEDDEFDIQYAPRNTGAFMPKVPNDNNVPPPPCEKCGKEFTNKKARSDHIWYCKKQKLHRCPVRSCLKEFKLKHDVMRHLVRHQTKRFGCPICKTRFFHKIDVENHLRGVHKLSPQGNKYPCDFCDKKMVTETDLSVHMQAIHGVDYAEICNLRNTEGVSKFNGQRYVEKREAFQRQQYYEEEEMKQEYQEEDYDDEDIPDPSSFLEQSLDASADNEEFKCDICPKSFPTRQKLMYHKYYHIREAKFCCDHCEERFKLRSHLERHIRTYHNEEKPVYRILNCPECPRKFTRDYDLAAHMLKIHQQGQGPSQQNQRPQVQKQPHPLSILKSTLSSAMNRNGPSTSVTRIAPASTSTSVRQSWPMQKNFPMKMGTMGRLSFGSQQQRSNDFDSNGIASEDTIRYVNGWYSCMLCKKAFKEKKSADAHRYYHNREEKYFCSSCSARFKQNSDLQRHIRIHHNSTNPKSSIKCPHCQRSFTDDRYLRMHIRRNHVGLNPNVFVGRSRISVDSNGSSYEEGRENSSSLIDDEEGQLEEQDEKEKITLEGQEDNSSDDNNVGLNPDDIDMELVEDEEENEKVIETWSKTKEEYMEYEYYGEQEEEDEDQRNMEEMEHLNYTADGAEEEEFAVACESCGVVLEDEESIANHVCSEENQNGETTEEVGEELKTDDGDVSEEKENDVKDKEHGENDVKEGGNGVKEKHGENDVQEEDHVENDVKEHGENEVEDHVENGVKEENDVQEDHVENEITEKPGENVKEGNEENGENDAKIAAEKSEEKSQDEKTLELA